MTYKTTLEEVTEMKIEIPNVERSLSKFKNRYSDPTDLKQMLTEIRRYLRSNNSREYFVLTDGIDFKQVSYIKYVKNTFTYEEES